MKYPEQAENYDVDVFNENFRELDLKGEQLGRDLQAESARADSAEKANAAAIAAETERATAQEGIIDSKFTAEAAVIRALIDTAYSSANGYTDEKIAALVNGAPETLDTLKEIADALEQNEDVVGALHEAIGTKANRNEFEAHVADAGVHVSTSEKSGWNNPQFTMAETREDISSGESIPTLWGKIKKWLHDLAAVAFSGSYKDLSDQPTIGDATIKITQGGVEKGSFTTNQAGEDVVIALEEGGSADPGGITPESIGAVAKSGDKMTGALRIETGEGVYGLFVGKQGEDYIAITNEWIQSVDGANRAKDLELQHWGGKIVAGGKMCLRNGMNVNNGLGEVTPESGYKYLMLFNGYTSDGTGGEVGYRNIAASGLGLHWGWCTSEIHSSGYYKIRIGHGANENWMASFLLSVYQNYEFDLFSISGYSYLGEHWYSPKATAIDATHTSGTTIRFGYDSDGVLWIAFPAGNYTGISIDCINRAYNSDYDWVGMFELRIEETLSGTEQTQVYVQPPIKWNKAAVTAAANSIVQRDSAGYIHATRFNQSSVIEGYPANMSAIFYEDNNDGYLRKMSPARMKTMLGIDELKNSVSNGKAAVASAITAKGVSTAADASFATMAANIGNIPSGWGSIVRGFGSGKTSFTISAGRHTGRVQILLEIWAVGANAKSYKPRVSGTITLGVSDISFTWTDYGETEHVGKYSSSFVVNSPGAVSINVDGGVGTTYFQTYLLGSLVVQDQF